ncbi:MAG: HlyC/CorC family transporter [Chloroflexi bacterium]|nr:HlyC/CorC family transporter [Chloroflexota bacterium]
MPEVGIILALVFLVFSAFFSSSEAAFLSLQKTTVAHLVNTDVPGARRVARMIEDPERLLSTILLGNNVVNVAFTASVTLIFISLLGDGSEGQAALLTTVAGTAALLLVGEIIPKTVAVHHAQRVAFAYAGPLKWIEATLWPLVVALQWITRRASSLLGGDVPIRGSITESELRSLIDIGEAEGTFEPGEAEMLENVFRFGDRQVREIMTPRTEIVSLERGASLQVFLDIYSEHAHTRFPVFKGTIDNVVGIISAKDILRTMATKGIDLGDSVTDVIRDCYFVPETKRVAELFDELRESGNQMAIAVDEYGGLAGLVSLKQLTEEVVGPVGEEGFGLEEEYETIGRDTFQVEGGMSVEEVNEELGIALPEGDFETIAGFVLDVLGQIPVEGQRLEYGNLKLEVTRMKGLKIETIKVTKTRAPEGSVDETDTGTSRRDGPE